MSDKKEKIVEEVAQKLVELVKESKKKPKTVKHDKGAGYPHDFAEENDKKTSDLWYRCGDCGWSGDTPDKRSAPKKAKASKTDTWCPECGKYPQKYKKV